jgi:hypothetical protein
VLEAAPLAAINDPLSTIAAAAPLGLGEAIEAGPAVSEVPLAPPLASGGSIDFIEEAVTAVPANPLFSSDGYTNYGLAIAGETPASAIVAAVAPNAVDADGEEVAPASGPQPRASAEPEEPPPDDEASAELQPQVVPVFSAVVSDLDDGWLR